MNKYLFGFFCFVQVILSFVLYYFSIKSEGIYTYSSFILIVTVIPLLDYFLPNDQNNPSSKSEETKLLNSNFFDFVLFFTVITMSGFFFLCYSHVSHFFDQNSIFELNFIQYFTLLGWLLTTGFACGYSVNVAHELGHRVNSWQRFLGKYMLVFSLRMSFYIEHNWGHHRHVATKEDPASAKKGENLYTFVPKTIFRTWLSAHKIQKELLENKGVSFFSFYNDVFWYKIIQWMVIIGFTFILGWETALFFVFSSFLGMFIVESINFVEHYGLVRTKNKSGNYERILPIHSWNSDHTWSNLILFNVQRHSDHHFVDERPYQLLRTFKNVPRLPSGYVGMILLAMVPPLFKKVMHKKLDEVENLPVENFTRVTV